MGEHNHGQQQNHQPEPLLGVKSKFDAEFRRFSISTTKLSYEEFERKVFYSYNRLIISLRNWITRVNSHYGLFSRDYYSLKVF